MKYHFLVLGLILALSACQVGLTTNIDKKLDVGGDENDTSVDNSQPSSEVSAEPSDDSVDGDGDGFSVNQDCDDANASIYPGAPEISDEDCSGSDETSSSGTDVDGDGYDSSSDCNDYDASIYPGAYEVPNNGIDEDCNGSDYTTGSGGSGYIGWESFTFAAGASGPYNYECDMNFNVVGTTSSVPCSFCDYAFDMTITYNANGSTMSSNCAGLATTQTFNYGFSSNYNGAATLLLYTGSPYYEWGPWITNGNLSINHTDSVNLSSSSFSYNYGYMDAYFNSYYYFGYYTYYFNGGGSQ